MGTKGWIIFATVAALLLGGLVYMSSANRIDVSGYDINKIISADEKNGNIGDNVFGNKSSKVVLIEYGDYQCPGCGSAYARVKPITDKYQGQIAFVFRNLPITSLHPNARAAAAVAQAAGLQGKYWEMHDKLYSSQNAWSGASVSDRTTIFRGYAESIGLKLDQYDKDVTSEAVNKKINFDQAIFKRTGFQQATPTFTLDGKQVPEDVWGSDDKLDAFVRDAITAAGIELPAAEKK